MLKADIERELTYFVDEPVFFDDERLRGGHLFPDKLADALCNSVCMIMVYTPNYFPEKHTFCAREYFAMNLIDVLIFSRR